MAIAISESGLGTRCENPATGELLGYSPLHQPEDVKQAILSARQAQKAWAQLSIRERAGRLQPIQRYLVENADALVDIITRDNGKVRNDALASEVLHAALAITYYTKNAHKFLRPKSLKSGNIFLSFKRSTLRRVPYGVIGVISPWNYPFNIPFSTVIMGLLAGNAVIMKTASETQLVGLALKQAIASADLPDDLFHYVNLPGKIAGAAFLDNGIDKLFFTGSVGVGKLLVAKSAETLTPLCLELGGNDPMIVCEDADLERAVAGAVYNGFQNCGQSCGGVERVYVHEKVYHAFLELLKQKTESLSVGYDLYGAMDMGAMTTQKQLETVQSHIREAIEQGAMIYAQSPVPKDPYLRNFIPAVVLTQVTHQMRVMREETFGPVVAVMPFKTVSEAIALANDSSLGLSASVWSKSPQKAKRIAHEIQVGAVMLNDHLTSHALPETPWGGFKESGTGRTHGQIGFDEMTQPQVIVRDVLPFVKKNVWWYPYSPVVYQGLKGFLQAVASRRFTSRLVGVFRLLKILPRMFQA